MSRVILHVDMNAFYASVECLLHPEFRNVPMVVCGDRESRHGIVLAKNELAKARGIKTAEVLWQAHMKCPGLVEVPANHDNYLKFSKLSRQIYLRYTPQMEPFGLDEAWLDISGRGVTMARGKEVADELRAVIEAELGITASVGVSFNKIFAKLGSDLKKPNATTVIAPEDFQKIVWPLPVGDLLYVGGSTQKKLERRNIRTVGDIAKSDPAELRRYLGKWGGMLYAYANGWDTDPVKNVDEEREIKSIGNSTTTPRDLLTYTDVRNVLYTLSENVAMRLKKYGKIAGCVQLYVRANTLERTTRQQVLDRKTDLSEDIATVAFSLFQQNYDLSVPVRSLGVRATGLADVRERQMDLFEDRKKIEREYAIEQIRRRFGAGAILRASVLEEPELTELEEGKRHIFVGAKL